MPYRMNDIVVIIGMTHILNLLKSSEWEQKLIADNYPFLDL